MPDKKDQEENLKTPEKRSPSQTEKTKMRTEAREGLSENLEGRKEDEIISAQLRKEIEMMEIDDKTKAEAEKAKEEISFLAEGEKIKHLLDIARKKGLVFAVQVARRMNEPYLLDILHDTLAQEGYYKDFTK